jgi:hypothetical protein
MEQESKRGITSMAFRHRHRQFSEWKKSRRETRAPLSTKTDFDDDKSKKLFEGLQDGFARVA